MPDLQTELCRYGCINTPGSYRCAEPMELKDQPILDSLSITCLPGYEQTSHGCIGESDDGKSSRIGGIYLADVLIYALGLTAMNFQRDLRSIVSER